MLRDESAKSANRLFGGLRAQRELGIIYFSWHVARVGALARLLALCKHRTDPDRGRCGLRLT